MSKISVKDMQQYDDQDVYLDLLQELTYTIARELKL